MGVYDQAGLEYNFKKANSEPKPSTAKMSEANADANTETEYIKLKVVGQSHHPDGAAINLDCNVLTLRLHGNLSLADEDLNLLLGLVGVAAGGFKGTYKNTI